VSVYEDSVARSSSAFEQYTTGASIESLLANCTDELVREHRKQVAAADGLVVVHPNWWGKPPAILAGWLDRVLVPGVAYRLQYATGEPEPLLNIRSAVVINTTDTPREREVAHLGDPLDSIWRRCVLPYCGAQQVERHIFGPVANSSALERAGWIAELSSSLHAHFC
jgi:NAD(P)H dehydrogenase (quinone)